MAGAGTTGFGRMVMVIGYVSAFHRDESGAVSTDWVVVCAFCVGLAIAVGNLFGGISKDHSERIGATMVSNGIKTY